MAPHLVGMSSDGKPIQFTINDKEYNVGAEMSPGTSLLAFIRDYAHLKGTKANCLQAACGACTVVASITDRETGNQKTFSLRACRTLVFSCNGWSIYTIEHVGDRYKGYHPLQKAMTGFYGTQCGYCSPGFVMSMYGELTQSGNLTAASVEKNVDGNICRCTGYRPILDAFKSLAVDASLEQRSKLADIEDAFETLAQCPSTGLPCKGTCSDVSTMQSNGCLKGGINNSKINSYMIQSEGAAWHRASSIKEIYKILQDSTNEKIRIVVGNTSSGIYPNDGPYGVYIDSSGVSDLYTVASGNPLVIGANVNLNRCIEVFEETAKMFQGLGYLQHMADHWNKIANTGVRNMGCWAGNLMTKKAHKEFPSDVFLTLASVGAKIKIGHSADSSTTEVNAEEFMTVDMSKSIILSVTLEPMEENVYYRSYKIAPSTVNSIGYVNAAFKMKLDKTKGYTVLEKPTIVYGGINDDFVHASETETMLTGKSLSDDAVLQAAVQKIKDEVKPDQTNLHASPDYRNSLSQALFYKAAANILGENVSPKMRCAGMTLTRPLVTGKQTFDPNEDTWPVGQAVPKLESNIQVAGEAEYLNDIEPLSNEVYGAFVQTSVARAQIKSIDPSEALKLSGVIDFVTVDDIKGEKNTFVKDRELDPLFTNKEVRYAGQPIGLIVAEKRSIANKAVKLVKVEYENIQTPVLTIRDALKKKENRQKLMELPKKAAGGPSQSNSKINMRASPHKVSGKFDQGTQFPFYMEPLAARVVPVEDGYDLFVTTQGPTDSQVDVAQILGVPNNNVNLTVKRIGGGFGGKINRANLLACAAAVAAQKHRRPVRIALSLTSSMSLVGWREPFYSEYEVGFDDAGKLLEVKTKIVSDVGHLTNDDSSQFCGSFLPSVYFSKVWDITPTRVNTDTAANTYVRAPGIVEAIATMETIIEHVAHYLKKDAVEIREINFKDPDTQKSKFGPKVENLVKTTMFPMVKEEGMYDTVRAEVAAFNKENRWLKRGLTVMPALWTFQFASAFKYQVQVMVYHEDGSVVISHGGIEMGQGLNTKVSQVAARYLQVPMNIISVKATNSFVGANSGITTGSSGSDVCANGARIVCERLRKRIDEVKKTLPASVDISWPDLVKACFREGVDMGERYWTNMNDLPQGYDIFSTALVEVELDVLTGQHLIRQAYLLQDTGRSMSPFVDIGQIEGSFIMGLGLYTCEEVKFDPKTGQKLTDSLWTYHPPSALDIPCNFKVSLLPKGDAPLGVVRAKAIGEPALSMSFAVVTALRDAIRSAREDAGNTDWFNMDCPLTVERVQQLCLVNGAQFKLHTSELSAPDVDDDDGLFEESFDIVRSDDFTSAEE